MEQENLNECDQEQEEEVVNKKKLYNVLQVAPNLQLMYTIDAQQRLTPENDWQMRVQANEDIIPQVYEGGFKVWECTQDLLQFLHEQNSDVFYNKCVADLGCGHGLLGIYALLRGARFVIFQDYNREVLEYAARQNITLNFQQAEQLAQLEQRLAFVEGDWSETAQRIAQLGTNAQVCDLALMSEVIYNPQNYQKIAQLLTQILLPGARCLMANKLFYYGVGGSLFEFKEFIEQKYATALRLESLRIINNKRGVKREIIMITRI